MPDAGTQQSKSPDWQQMRVEALARKLLNQVLPMSVNGRPTEYGGVIYRNNTTSRLDSTGPFHDPGNSVNVQQDQPNMGCPDGTVPVAWYHTHPLAKFGDMHVLATDFIDNDRAISDEHHIPGYLGVYDGSFWCYDPGTQKMQRLNGKLKNTLP